MRRTSHGTAAAWGLAILLLGAAPLASCMRAGGLPRGPVPGLPVADSVTVARWSMDEVVGDYASDSGPSHLEAALGADAGADFGRFRGARSFTASLESFLYVPYDPALESPNALTVEAWIRPAAYGTREDTPIACRWTPYAGEQSWLLGIVGSNPRGFSTLYPSPGDHIALTSIGQPARLVFAIQPEEASVPLSYISSDEIELRRWTHVAATFDGSIVRLYLDGRLDSQFALRGRIRPSRAPLLVGNYFDTRRLSDFGGRWRVGGGDRVAYYAYEGLIDELRISSVARTEFAGASGR